MFDLKAYLSQFVGVGSRGKSRHRTKKGSGRMPFYRKSR